MNAFSLCKIIGTLVSLFTPSLDLVSRVLYQVYEIVTCVWFSILVYKPGTAGKNRPVVLNKQIHSIVAVRLIPQWHSVGLLGMTLLMTQKVEEKNDASSLFNAFSDTSSLAWTVIIKAQFTLDWNILLSFPYLVLNPYDLFLLWNTFWEFWRTYWLFFPCNYNEWELLLSSFKKGHKGTIKVAYTTHTLLYAKSSKAVR